MSATYYNEYRNDLYNPDDDERRPGLNDNWRQIQKGFHQVEGDQEDQDERMTEIEGKNTEQDGRLTAAEGRLTSAEGRLTTAESDIEDIEEKNTQQDGRLDAVEGRLTTAEGDIEDIEEAIAAGPAVLKMTMPFNSMPEIAVGDVGGIDMLIAEDNKDTLLEYDGASAFLVVVGIRATASYTDLIPWPVRVKVSAQLPVCYNVITKTQIEAGCTVGVYLQNNASTAVTIADDTLYADFYFIPIG